jgi:hypothetical protein
VRLFCVYPYLHDTESYPSDFQINTKKMDTQKVFDEHHVIHELKHYLLTQTPLKDFIIFLKNTALLNFH